MCIKLVEHTNMSREVDIKHVNTCIIEHSTDMCIAEHKVNQSREVDINHTCEHKNVWRGRDITHNVCRTLDM